MVETLQRYIEKNRGYIILFFIAINLLVSVKSRGGIILFSNLFYGSGIILIGLLSLIEFKKGFSSSLKNWSLLTFLGLFLFSFPFSDNKGYGVGELALFSSSIALYLYVANRKISEKAGEIIKTFLLITAVLTVLFGIYVYISYPYERLASFFYNFEDKFIGYPNALADFLLIIFPLSFYRHGKYKILLQTIIISGIILTFSRGAYLSLILELILIAYFYRRQLLRTKTLSTIALVCVFSLGLVSGVNTLRESRHDLTSIEEKISFAADEKAASVNERWEFFKGAFKIIKDHPLSGTGSDSFQFVYPSYQEIPFSSSNHPHNLFLKVAVENGFLSGIFLGIFFLTLLWQGIRSKKTAILSIGIIALLSHNLLDYNLNFIPNILLLFLFAGLIAQENIKKHQKNYFIPVIVICLTIFISALSLHEGYYNYIFQQGRTALNEENYQIALEKLETAKKLKFPRRLYLSLGEAAQGLEKTELAEKYFKKAAKINTHDALAYNLAGEYQKALEKDSKNYLKFHYDYLAAKANFNKEEKTQYENLLKNFLPVLANNQHNIILTDNPEHAIKIAQLLGFRDLELKLTKLKAREEEKFREKFNFDFSVL